MPMLLLFDFLSASSFDLVAVPFAFDDPTPLGALDVGLAAALPLREATLE